MQPQTTVSVIVPSYNSSSTIDGVIRAILDQTAIDAIKEIIVVDSSDDDSTRLMLKLLESSRVSVIDAGTRVMPAVARNIGARCASGDLLVFIDSDVYPQPQWLQAILSAFNLGCHAGTGSLGLCRHQRKTAIAAAQFYLQLNEYLQAGRLRMIRFPSGSNMFCKRSLFEKVGGIPEMRASEEVVFGLKLHKYTSIWFVPDAAGCHLFREQWSGYLKNQMMLGKFISMYRKINDDCFLLSDGVSLGLSPAIAFVKTALITKRIAGCGWNHSLRFVSVLPAVMLGILFWTAGFVLGCRSR